MHVESKLVGTFLVKSSATSAVPELRFSTCPLLVRLLILDDEMESQMMESQMRSCLKGFIVHHQVSFAHSLCIHRPCQWH